MVAELKKTIGKKERQVDAGEVFYKLYALKEMAVLIIKDINELGVRVNPFDELIVAGFSALFDDVLTEMDQLFYDGVMMRPYPEPTDYRTEEKTAGVEEAAERAL